MWEGRWESGITPREAARSLLGTPHILGLLLQVPLWLMLRQGQLQEPHL